MDERPVKTGRWLGGAVLAATIFAAAYAVHALFGHWAFASGFDLAIFDQAVWHMSRFEVPASTVNGYPNLLGIHFSPALALPTHYGIGGHYAAPLAPLLATSAGDALAGLAARVRDAVRRRRVLSCAVALSIVASALVPGHQPLLRLFTARHYASAFSHDAGRRALALIPADASVVAQVCIAPHLSQRQQIFILETAPDADYVIAARHLNPWPMSGPADIDAFLGDYRSRGYLTRFDEQGWVVLQRASADSK